MRTFLFLITFLVASGAVDAQTSSTFEMQPLSGTDTFYINYSASGSDVGFNDGLVHFPCVYDTSFGGYWSSGFAFSNMTDDTTSGYLNQYSAITGMGYGGSAKYAVAYGNNNWVSLIGAARGKKVMGAYFTNNTYAHNSMRDGDFAGKKFGGTTGNDPDWFLLTIKGYLGGVLKPDSVNFYLADFRPVGTANDSIIKGWHWVDFSGMGNLDSLAFYLSSSDTGAFGMNTPAYFCIDNFTTNETNLNITVCRSAVAKIYPVPATNALNIDLNDDAFQTLTVTTLNGEQVCSRQVSGSHTAVDIAELPSGIYVLYLNGANGSAQVKFVKQ